MRSKRTPVIAANWKMNTTVSQAIELSDALTKSLDSIPSIEVVICPPSISLTAVREVITGSRIKLGAQNVYHEDKGAFTGELSPLMLVGICEYVLIGHSERRTLFAEDDKLINKKVVAAESVGLNPILCVGETLNDRDSAVTAQVLACQVREGIKRLNNPQGLIVAYEPVWAIGTGKAATPSDSNEAISIIRRTVSKALGKEIGEAVRILYGGSVNPANIIELMAEPEIDGVLVGGASLNAHDFYKIVSGALKAKHIRPCQG